MWRIWRWLAPTAWNSGFQWRNKIERLKIEAALRGEYKKWPRIPKRVRRTMEIGREVANEIH